MTALFSQSIFHLLASGREDIVARFASVKSRPSCNRPIDVGAAEVEEGGADHEGGEEAGEVGGRGLRPGLGLGRRAGPGAGEELGGERRSRPAPPHPPLHLPARQHYLGPSASFDAIFWNAASSVRVAEKE